MQKIYTMIIIGGGPAGCTAALYAARAGLEPLVIERMAVGGQMTLTGTIENYPGFEEGVDGFTLGLKMQKGAERYGAQTEYAEVLSVDFSEKVKVVETSIGRFYAKTVVIAAGANPRKLGIPGEQELTGRGVHYCAHCDGRFYQGKTVVVVGGGNSAVSDALYLSRMAAKVFLIHRREHLRADRIYRDLLMRAENVEFIPNVVLTELISEGGTVGVRLQNSATRQRTELSCDGVFVGIGRCPATEFLAGCLELDPLGYIVADESTRTNADGVFAVGDVRAKAFRQVVTAVSDGAVAVHFAEKYLAEIENNCRE